MHLARSELLLKLSEGRVQSKHLKTNCFLHIQMTSNKIFWQSKSVLSTTSPIWNQSKNFPASTSSITLDLIQTDSQNTETLLGSVIIAVNDLISQRKTWWDIKSGNSSSIAFILIEIFLLTSTPNASPHTFISPPSSPPSIKSTRPFHESPSFSIPTPPKTPTVTRIENYSNYIEKIKLDLSKVTSEKSILETISKNLDTREKNLRADKMKLVTDQDQLQKEKEKLQKLIASLETDYFALKKVKILNKIKLFLMSSKLKKTKKLEEKFEKQKNTIFPIPEISRRLHHPVIQMTESVKPIFHEPDSPPESPVFTQDSTDHTEATLN